MAHPVRLPSKLHEPAVVDNSVDDGGGHLVVPEDPSPAGELEVRGDDHALPLVGVGEDLEDETRAVGVERQNPSSSITSRRARAICDISRSSRPSSRARRRRMTSEEAVKKRASIFLSHASWHSALAMWVLPVPTSPISTKSSRRSRNDSESRSSLPRPSGHDTADQS